MTTPPPEVAYVLPDKMGGVHTIVANLLAYRRPDAFRYRAVLTHNQLQHDARAAQPLIADVNTMVEYALPIENLSAVLRRLHAAVGSGPGVLVCNDHLDLLLAASRPIDRTVIQILHGDYDYYYDLAAEHEPYVHAFVAYSRTVYERLRDRLPQRRDDVFWLPYGVTMPEATRHAVPGPLRVLFVGRLDEAKGVLDLPAIDRGLRHIGIDVRWTVIGSGPAGAELTALWADRDVAWVDQARPEEVRECYGAHDILLLPSRAEGLSVATVEAMSAGTVPVVSDLVSMRELVDGVTTGLRVAVGDVDGFVAAIAGLSRDRARLDSMSAAARALARARFEPHARASAYQDLFGRWQALRRQRPAAPLISPGSRLDAAWLPNPVVRFVRSAMRSRR